MNDEDNRLQFSFELVDNVSDHAKEIESNIRETDSTVEEYTQDAERAIQTDRRLQSTTEATQVRLLTQMAVIGSLDGAVRSISGGMQALGIVSDETAAQLGKVGAAFGIIKGTAQGLTAIKGLMATLNAQTAINASLSSYLAVLKNPAMLAGVALAGGAALGFAGAYLMTSNNNSTTNNTTINVDSNTPQNATNNIIKIVEGGAL